MKNFIKEHATIVIIEGNHFLVNEHGKIGGQIKSVVIDECLEQSTAEITFQVNICSTLEEAMEKYKEI